MSELKPKFIYHHDGTASRRVTTEQGYGWIHEPDPPPDPSKQVEEAGVELARANARIRELEVMGPAFRRIHTGVTKAANVFDESDWDDDEVTEERVTLAGVVKAAAAFNDEVTEERLVVRDPVAVEYHHRSGLALLLGDATNDELAVVLAFVQQLMGEGRNQYGPLDLSKDGRSLMDMLRDVMNEGLDRNFYALVAGIMSDRGLK